MADRTSPLWTGVFSVSPIKGPGIFEILFQPLEGS